MKIYKNKILFYSEPGNVEIAINGSELWLDIRNHPMCIVVGSYGFYHDHASTTFKRRCVRNYDCNRPVNEDL